MVVVVSWTKQLGKKNADKAVNSFNACCPLDHAEERSLYWVVDENSSFIKSIIKLKWKVFQGGFASEQVSQSLGFIVFCVCRISRYGTDLDL